MKKNKKEKETFKDDERKNKKTVKEDKKRKKKISTADISRGWNAKRVWTWCYSKRGRYRDF